MTEKGTEMKKILSIFLILSALTTFLAAQTTYKEFRQQTINYYHNILNDDVKNFSCLITSATYIDFIKQYADSNFYYPLKIIWMNDGSSYYEVQPFPALGDSLQKQVYARAQALKNLWSYIFPDLNKFVFYQPFQEIPDTAGIEVKNDTVSVFFEVKEGQKDIRSRQTFTKGGMLGRVVWYVGDRKEVYFPTYKEMGDKWICLGWDGQVYQNGEVKSGLRTSIVYLEQNGKFLPEQINIIVQSRDENGKPRTNTRILFLKDFKFNQDVRVITTPTDSTNTGQKAN
jgi:hypothetical protein